MGILDLYQKNTPKTAKANIKGGDSTPVGFDNPRGEFKPSRDLSKDEKALKKARGGELNLKKYTDTPKK